MGSGCGNGEDERGNRKGEEMRMGEGGGRNKGE